MRKFLKSLLIVAIIISLIPYKANAQTMAELESELQKYIDQANANKDAINKTEEEIKQTNNEIEQIKQEMKDLQAEIVKLNEEIKQYNEEIKQKSLETEELFRYLQVSQGENIYLEYAFGAETITDLIYRMAIVDQMTEYNNQVMDELEQMIEANKKREKEIDEIKVQLSNKQKDLESKLITLGNKKQSLVVGGASIDEQIKIYQGIVDGYRKQGCKSNDVIGVTCAKGSSGAFRRPVSVGYITSEFGWRWGSFHRAVDISNGDPYNTKIYPVANGTITSIYNDIYGALILIITHYDAVSRQYYSSLYAHMSSYAPNLYVGKYVTTDDYIGYMGMTGYASGPHLHLEIAPCRIYQDSNCGTWDDYLNYIRDQADYHGYGGPRQLINFPSGLYNAWYSR